MKKALVLVAVLALVGAASAEIQLYWSTTGLGNSALKFSTALTNFLPIVAPTPLPASIDDPTTPTLSIDLYLWGRFIETPEMPAYSTIYGLDLKNTGAPMGSNAAYRQNKSGSGAYKRWDGSAGIPLDGVMAAVTARGVEFVYLPDTNNDLSIKYASDYGDFLIGAAHYDLAWGQHARFELDGAVDGLGIAMRYFGGSEPVDIVDPPVLPADFVYTPEPASLLLLGLAGLLIRRR